MTIKEVENILGVPRATVRFYEKEGLISPDREENGYRTYSEEKVSRLKQVIILRKLGIAVNDIEDILDGVRPLSEAVSENIVKLEKQISEIKGAMNICQKIQDNGETLSSFNPDKYWNAMETEERKGNHFMDIAMDVIHYEKATILGYFGLNDINGNLSASIPKAIFSVALVFVITGCLACFIDQSWTIPSFMNGVYGVLWILSVELVLGLPLYLLGKKYPAIAKNRGKILVGICLILCVLLFAIGIVTGM